VCLQRRCLAIYVLLSRALTLAGICLPSRYLALGIRVKILPNSADFKSFLQKDNFLFKVTIPSSCIQIQEFVLRIPISPPDRENFLPDNVETGSKHESFPWAHPEGFSAASTALHCRDKGASSKVSEVFSTLYSAYSRHHVYTLSGSANWVSNRFDIGWTEEVA
jgi:hypothetical protein